MSSSALRRPVRILYVDHTAMLGGGEIALLHLVTHLDRTRFHPVVVLSSAGELVGRLESAGIETHVLPLNPAIVHTRKDSLNASSMTRLKDVARVLKYSCRLATFIRRHKIDIVHTNSLKSDIFGGIAARLARVPLVWHVRDRIAADYLPRTVCKVFRWLCRFLPDFVIANSQATMDTLALPEKKPAAIVFSGSKSFQVVHDGIVTATTRSVVSELPPAADAEFRIGLVGRLAPWKGQDVFINAASKVRRRFPGAKFLIAGSAMFGEQSFEAAIRELVIREGLENTVQFLGFRSDITAFIESLDMLVHASTVPEPFGQVVIEGMAAAKPVVATRGGGVLEIVEDGVNGILVGMGNADEMSDAICRILIDPAGAAAMGHAARRTVLERFTIDLTAETVQEIYETIRRPKHQGALRRPTTRTAAPALTASMSGENTENA